MLRFLLAAGPLLVGCSGVPFLVPDTRTPADHAREIEPRCRGFDEAGASAALSPGAVDSVEPSVSHVKSGPNDREARPRGARIHVRPLPGFSPEALQRTLECHQARVVLGRASPVGDDPYVLAGHWLDIAAASEGDGLVVDVRTDDADGARQVLEAARRFAKPGKAP